MQLFKRLQIETANVLFVYDNVLKSPDPFVVKAVKTKYRDDFKDFLDFTLVDTMDNDEALSYGVMSRTKKNPLEWIAKKPFDYDKFYNKLKKKTKTVYFDAMELYQYRTLREFSRSYCINDIYIWNNYYDMRQHADLQDIITESQSIQYCVSDDLVQCLDEIGDVNLVYDWDIDRIKKIVEAGNHNHIFFALAAYPFNLKDGHLKYDLDKYDNVGLFPAIKKPTKDIFFG